MSEPHTVFWGMNENDGISYGLAIFRNKEGQRVVYRLCYPQATDPETSVKNFKPREFVEATVEDHDGSGNIFRYTASGDPLDITDPDEDPDS